MVFNKESDFEEALIKILSEKGWEKEVLKNYSEKDLLRNWADILFENNRDIDIIFKRLKKTYQKSSVYRYDSLADMGGQLSSVIVMLDEKDDGFLINSVHSTTAGTYTYVKKITDGLADVELAEEESLALAEAMGEKRKAR